MKIGKKFEIDSEEVFIICATIAIIIGLLTSCHPYPYKSIKPDKTKQAQFR